MIQNEISIVGSEVHALKVLIRRSIIDGKF